MIKLSSFHQHRWLTFLHNLIKQEPELLADDQKEQIEEATTQLELSAILSPQRQKQKQILQTKQKIGEWQKQPSFLVSDLEKKLEKLDDETFGALLADGVVKIAPLGAKGWRRLLTLPAETCREVYRQNIETIVDWGYPFFQELTNHIIERGAEKNFLPEDNTLMDYFLQQPDNEQTREKLDKLWLPVWDEAIEHFLDKNSQLNGHLFFGEKQQEYIFLAIPLLKNRLTCYDATRLAKNKKALLSSYAFLKNAGDFLTCHHYRKIIPYLAQEEVIHQQFKKDLLKGGETTISKDFAWRLACSSEDPEMLPLFLQTYRQRVDQIAACIAFVPPQNEQQVIALSTLYQYRIFAENLLRKMCQYSTQNFKTYPPSFLRVIEKMVAEHYSAINRDLVPVEFLTALGQIQPITMKTILKPFAQKGDLLATIALSESQQRTNSVLEKK